MPVKRCPPVAKGERFSPSSRDHFARRAPALAYIAGPAFALKSPNLSRKAVGEIDRAKVAGS